MSADTGAPIRSGLTGAEWLLIAEVLAALVALGIWWHQFSIHSPEYEVRMRAVKKLADLQVVRRVALEDPDPFVREAAVARVSDQQALRTIVTTDTAPIVRKAALGKLDDPALTAQIARSDRDDSVRVAAAHKVGDMSVLATLATGSGDEAVRRAALERLSDPAALMRVAANDAVADLRTIAFGKLNAQELERSARQEADPRRRLELATAARFLLAVEVLPAAQRKRVAMKLLSLPLRFSDPLWTSRFGAALTIKLEWAPSGRSYSGPSGFHNVSGESITLRATFARAPAALTAQWHSLFPSSVSRGYTWAEATLNPATALIPWLASHDAALAQLAVEDPLPEIRAAAANRLNDRSLLDRIAKDDKDTGVRAAAQARARSIR